MTNERALELMGMSKGPPDRVTPDVSDAEREDLAKDLETIPAAVESLQLTGGGESGVLALLQSPYLKAVMGAVFGETGIDFGGLVQSASTDSRIAAAPGGFKGWLVTLMKLVKPSIDKGHVKIMERVFHKTVPADEPCPVWWRIIALLEGKSIIAPT